MDSLYNILGIPFGFVLTIIYTVTGNYVMALILFTLLTKLIMLPSSISQQKGQVKSVRLQPKLRRIQARYAGNQQKIQEETQALYSREGYNPMNAGCVPMLIQFPILFGLIGAIYNPLNYPLGLSDLHIASLTEAVKTYLGGELSARDIRTVQLLIIENIEHIKEAVPASVYQSIADFDFSLFGLSLGATPSFSQPSALWIIPILSFAAAMATAVVSFIRQKETNPEAAKNPMMGCMSFGMPLFSLYIAFQFPIGIGLYWTASSLFSFIQMLILNRTHSSKKLIARQMIEETIERRSREENLKLIAKK